MFELSPTQERILNAAEEQFRMQGYSQTTMDHLAEQLGMSKKTLYENFRSKEQIAAAMISRIGETVHKTHQEIIASNANTIEKLLMLSQKLRQCLITITSPALLNDLKRNAPELWQQIKAVRNERIRTIWGYLLREGMEKGYFRQEINSELFIMLLMISSERLLDGGMESLGSESYIKLKTDLMDIFLNGILSVEGRDALATSH